MRRDACSVVVGRVFESEHFDPCRQEGLREILRLDPRLLLGWPFWFTVAKVAELAFVSDGVTSPVPALLYDAAYGIWIPCVPDSVLYDDADGEHTSPALVAGFVVHGLGEALLFIGFCWQGR